MLTADNITLDIAASGHNTAYDRKWCAPLCYARDPAFGDAQLHGVRTRATKSNQN